MENYPLTVAGIQEMVSDIMKAREADINKGRHDWARRNGGNDETFGVNSSTKRVGR